MKLLSSVLLLTLLFPSRATWGQTSCEAQRRLQTEIGERYELGMTISPILRTFSLPHPGARYIRALLNLKYNPKCDWAVILRDNQYRVMEIYSADTFLSGDKWSHRISGDQISFQLSPCGSGALPTIVVESYIEMPAAGKNPYYSVQDPNLPAYKDLYSSDFTSVPEGVRQLGDNAAFLMSSYGNTSWVCSGVMLQPGLLLTNWHCGGTSALKSTDYWNSQVVKDLLLDVSWDGDTVSREYTGVKLLAGSEELDYALIQVSPADPSDTVLRLKITTQQVQVGQAIYIVHHPVGLVKQLSNCEVESTVNPTTNYAKNSEFTYKCDTEKGSSGAPVFTAKGELIGLHHLGFDQNKDCATLDKENKGVKVTAILADLAERYPQVYEMLASK